MPAASSVSRIHVDADSCPVKAEILRVADRHGIVVLMVMNGAMRLPPSPLLHRVVVSDAPDAADDWIADHVACGDIVVTADIPLAARCLKEGARVLGHDGRPFTQDSIGTALAMRDLKAGLRDIGALREHAPPFARRDRLRFLDALEALARKAAG